MISAYIEKKLKTAQYKILEDKNFFGEIPSIKGVWSHASTLEECRQELVEILEEWMLLKIRDNEKIPGLTIRFDLRQVKKYA